MRAHGPTIVPAVAGLLAASITLGHAGAETVTIHADRDGTLIEAEGSDWSLGAAWNFYVGRVGPNGGGLRRRGLIRFPVDMIPPGSTITSVAVKLYLSKGQSGAQVISFKRCLSDWGEGASFAFGGAGALSEENDVSWTKRFWPDVAWDTPGGDFVSTASVLWPCGALGWYTFGSTPGLVADVQQWVDGTLPNYGWVLTGNESALQTVKRFESRETTAEAWRPVMIVEFIPPQGVVGDLNGDGIVNGADLAILLGAWGPCEGCPADLDGNGVVDGADLAILIGHWSQL